MDGLTLDVEDDLLYWTDFTYKNIQRADLDGRNRRTIVKGLDKPRAIVLDKGKRLVNSPGTVLLAGLCRTIYVPVQEVYLSQARLPAAVGSMRQRSFTRPSGTALEREVQIKPE